MAQLTLPLSLPNDETFASFYAGENTALIATLKSSLAESGHHTFYLWSNSGSGKSHLLHAACSLLTEQGKAVGYIPLSRHDAFTPAVLEGLEQLPLVCIDDINAIAGIREWEVALFNLYNRILDTRDSCLIVTGNSAPRELNLTLPDLASRLDWGQVYKLHPLSDNDKLYALQLRAELRGFVLPDDVGKFMLKRLDRDIRTLCETLDRLDVATMEAQRKLTIPFVKEILSL